VTPQKWIAVIAAVSVAAVLAFAALSASGNGGPQPFDGMSGMMEGGGMQMPVSKDVIILLESEYEMAAGEQSEVTLKVLDKQTNEPIEGARVITGMEEGLPMTTMEMAGDMFDASGKGNGTYAFVFTPESKGYYTVHAHVVLPGKQMHSMMENHADLATVSK
jgi:hypothetical protein